MTAVVILNIVFAVFVVAGIVALLGSAILADKSYTPRARRVRVPATPARFRSARSARGAFDFGG